LRPQILIMDTNFQPVISTSARGRYRQHPLEFKRALVALSLQPGTSVARIAREHSVNAVRSNVLADSMGWSQTAGLCLYAAAPVAGSAAGIRKIQWRCIYFEPGQRAGVSRPKSLLG
jgi:hypothetical protein